MGDIFRKINICGLTSEGKQLGCEKGKLALIDTGATQTVISGDLAKKIRGKNIRGMEANIEGRNVPVKLTGIALQAPKCEIGAVVVAVDSSLSDRAGMGPNGEKIEVILGHDYLQRQRATLKYVAAGDEVFCSPPPNVDGLGGTSKKKNTRRKK